MPNARRHGSAEPQPEPAVAAAPDPAADCDFLLRRSPVTARLPAELRQRIDAELLAAFAVDRPLEAVWRDHELDARFGITAADFADYAKGCRAAMLLATCGDIARAITSIDGMPTADWSDLQQAALRLLLGRIVQAVQHEEPTPERLAKLADALQKHTAATIRLQALQLQIARHVETRARRGDKAGGDRMTFAEAVRRIYGIQLPVAPGDESPAPDAPTDRCPV